MLQTNWAGIFSLWIYNSCNFIQVWYDSDGSGSGFKFFYFVDNQLTHLDEGEKAVDY